jgi:hypothetical protein
MQKVGRKLESTVLVREAVKDSLISEGTHLKRLRGRDARKTL